MVKIARHKTDLEFCEEVLKEHLEYSSGRKERARFAPSNLSSAATHHLSIAQYSSVVSPLSDNIPRYVVLASYALSALFRVARAHGEPITCELGYGEPAVYKQPVDESLIEANNWITAFFLGLIRRDNETLNELCLTSADDLRRSSTRHPEYRYLFANALRAHWLRDRKTTKYLLGAIKAANPKKQKFHNEKHVQDIDVPLMQLFLCILSEDSRIEEKAIDAIKLHKGYWGASSRRDDRIGFISIGLTAMLSLADRRGLTVHIESDYTPSRLVTRDFTDMSE